MAMEVSPIFHRAGRGEFIPPERRRGAAASPPGGGPAGSAGRSRGPRGPHSRAARAVKRLVGNGKRYEKVGLIQGKGWS